MGQPKKALNEVRIPLAKMSYTPDVPSAALGPNEYNAGSNVETDVRGIRSVSGEQATLPDGVPGTPTYISGGFRQPVAGVANDFYFIVATNEGRWWASNGEATSSANSWVDITPPGGVGTYTQAQNITEAWSGTVPIFNDEQNPPIFWPEVQGVQYPQMLAYSNLFPAGIANIAYVSPTVQQITLANTFTSTGSSIGGTTLTIGTVTGGTPAPGQYISGTGVAVGTKIVNNISGTGSGSTWIVSTSQTVSSTGISGGPYESAPYSAGDLISITEINNFYNGFYTVVSSSLTTINYTAAPGAAYPGGGSVAPRYSWNYNPLWRSVYAKFMRLYNTPNVGNILVAGNLTATTLDGAVEEYPVAVQWSQQFGQNQVPATWEPTVLNVANQLDVPLRGGAIDAFPSNGQLFLCSYWDTVVFSPINYSTTTTPILGVRLFNQGRGLLSSNCWANTDKMVYGIDARDIWVFNGQDFAGIGNQRVKQWFFDQLDPLHVDRVFMQVNTYKNQVEIYYPTVEATAGVPNKMLAYRYDLDVWNAPRDVNSATFACESPRWLATPDTFWRNRPTVAVTGTGTGARLTVQQVGPRYKSYASRGDIIQAGTGYVVGNQIKILGTQLGGATPANDCVFTITAVNGSGGITGFAAPPGGLAVGTFNYDPGSRLVVYARGDADVRIVQKDVGYFLLDDTNGVTLPVTSSFRRDNIKMLEDYSGKLLVHRIMPEVVNLYSTGVPIDPATAPGRVGTINVTIEGANSVGQTPQASTAIVLSTDTDAPWTQINQNAYRVNSLTLGHSSTSDIWLCSAVTWQYTQTEDDR